MHALESKELALDKLASVGMREDVGELLPSEISGGMQKRVGFARAIANDPEIVLLDEPTAGLDPIMTNVVNELILDGVRTLGATALSITSDMGGARKIGDRVAMIYNGRIIWDGTPDEVEQSGNDYVDQFIHKTGRGPDPNGGDRLNCPDVICLQKTNCRCACERPSDARQRYSGVTSPQRDMRTCSQSFQTVLPSSFPPEETTMILRSCWTISMG